MKKLLWTVGVLLVLLVAGVLIGPGLVDWNQYKGDIQAQAKNATGRALTINGDIKITILPAPALIASGVLLANAEGATAKNMVTLKHLEVRIAMAPLLTGRIEVERIKLVDPVIELEVLADGRNNWTFEALEGAAAEAPEGERGIIGRRQGTVVGPEVALDNFTIENGTLVYRDAKGGTFERIEKINANITAASLNGPFESTGGFRVRGLPLTYGINVGEIIHGRTVPFNLKFGVQPAGLNMQLSGTVVGMEDTPKIKGKIKGKGESLAWFIQAVEPGRALPGLFGQAFSFEGAVAATAKGGGLTGLNISIGNTQVTGAITVETGKTLAVAANLTAKRIDLDTWLALPPVRGQVAPEQNEGARDSKARASGGAGAAVPQPFSLPKNINGSLAFNAEAITFKGGVIQNAVVNVELANGEATISQLSAQFPGGSNLALFGFVTSSGGVPRFEGELESTVNDLRGVLSWLGHDMDGIQPDRLRKLTLAARVVALPEQIQLTGLDLQFDSSRLTGGMAVALTKRPSFGVDFTIDRLNLDAYLPKPLEKTAPKKKGGKAGALAGDGKTQKDETPFSALKVLTGLDANLKTRIGTLIFQGARIKDVTVDGTLYNGRLEIRRLGIARMAGARATVSGVLKGFDGIPEAEALAFNVQVDDVPGFLRFLGQDPALAPKGLGPVAVNGRIDGKLLSPKFKVRVEGAGATVSLDGRIDGLSAVPSVKGLKFKLAAADASGLLKLAGIDTPGAAKQLGAVNVTGSLDGNLLKPDLTLNLQAAGGNVTVSGPVSMLPVILPVGDRADLGLKASFPDFARLLRALGAGYRPSGKVGALDLQARLKVGPKAITVSGIDAKIGATQVKGNVVMRLDGPRPNIKADLTSGAIVIDPFLPARKSASLWGDAKILPAAWLGPPSAPRPGPGPLLKLAAKGRWPTDPIDLSGLAAVDGDITFKSPLVQFEKYKLANADLAVKMVNGRVTADKLTGVLFGGALHATGSVTATARPRIETAFALENMNIGQAMQAFTGSSAASGRLSMKARLQTSGKSIAGMISGLNGSGSLRIKGADVKQGKTGTAMAGALGLIAALNQFGGILGGGRGKGSGLVDISGSFDITGGIARSQDMKVTASVGNGAAAGAIDLPRWLIDVKGHIQLSQNLLTAFLAAKTKRNITQRVPFTVKGRLDAPTINLDTSKITGGGLPIPGVDKLLKKAPKGVGAILQGILGGQRQPPPAEPQPQQQPQPQQKITPEDLLKELFKRR